MSLKAFDQILKREARTVGVTTRQHNYEKSIQNENFLTIGPAFLRTFLCAIFFIWSVL